MRIEVKAVLKVGGAVVRPGDVVDVPEREAKYLCATGKGEKTAKPVGKAPKQRPSEKQPEKQPEGKAK